MSVPVRPRRTNAALKRAPRSATRTSLARARAKPPPAAAPCRPSRRRARGWRLGRGSGCTGAAGARLTNAQGHATLLCPAAARPFQSCPGTHLPTHTCTAAMMGCGTARMRAIRRLSSCCERMSLQRGGGGGGGGGGASGRVAGAGGVPWQYACAGLQQGRHPTTCAQCAPPLVSSLSCSSLPPVSLVLPRRPANALVGSFDVHAAAEGAASTPAAPPRAGGRLAAVVTCSQGALACRKQSAALWRGRGAEQQASG